MEINKKFPGALPHLIAIVLFIFLSFAYFYPVLEGKILRANDSMVSKINSKEINDYRAKFHKEPLWTNSIFSGMPAYLISTQYPGNLMRYADKVLRIFKMPVSVLFLSMAGFYVMLLLFGFNPWLSIAGSIAYGFSSFFFQILAAGHNTQAVALAYMAPMIGAIYYAYRRDALKGALLAAFLISLEIIANHPQITYYSMICLLIFIITEFVYSIKEKSIVKFLKTSVLLIVPFIIAVGINFASLYTVYEYGKYTIRGKSDLVSETRNVSSGLDRDYITFWSYGIDETMNLLIPNYKGGSSKPFNRNSETVRALKANNAQSAVNQVMKYWGTQPGTDGPHYMGAIVIFLFILGIVVVRGREKWWLLIATILSIMLSWGKNFMPLTNLFIDYFPGYNKFRAVTMTLVIAEFCVPLLGFLAIRQYFNGFLSRKEMLKGLKIAGGITGGLLLLILLIPGIAGSFLSPYESGYPDWLTSAMVSDRKELLRSDAFRSFMFVLLAAGVLLGYIYGKLKKEYSILIIGLLVLIDLWSADKRYLDADRFEKQSVMQKTFTPTTADKVIMQDKSYYRVLNLSVSTFNDNTPTSWFHKSIGGYHGAKLKRYQELIDSSIIREIEMFSTAAQKATTVNDLISVFDKTPALNMLNAKYVIINPEAPPLINPHALGNAWFVEKAVIAENANQELAYVNTIDPLKEAAFDARFKDQVQKTDYQISPGDSIRLVSYEPNELVYKYNASNDGVAIFSEIYYAAGWKCFIDGKETGYFRANFVLRGVVAPAGNHEIRFTFRPSSYLTGNKVSLAGSILLILLSAGYIGLRLTKK
ncbi:MAG: YfhO family protein [Bacteroidota bacterium]|nr:YfhO family protein [Bacteroidota bacterium]